MKRLYDAYKKTGDMEGLARQLADSIKEHIEKQIERETKRIEALLAKQARMIVAEAESVKNAARKVQKQLNDFLL